MTWHPEGNVSKWVSQSLSESESKWVSEERLTYATHRKTLAIGLRIIKFISHTKKTRFLHFRMWSMFSVFCPDSFGGSPIFHQNLLEHWGALRGIFLFFKTRFCTHMTVSRCHSDFYLSANHVWHSGNKTMSDNLSSEFTVFLSAKYTVCLSTKYTVCLSHVERLFVSQEHHLFVSQVHRLFISQVHRMFVSQVHLLLSA